MATLSSTARSIRIDAGRLQPRSDRARRADGSFAMFDRLSARIGLLTRHGHRQRRRSLRSTRSRTTSKGLLAESPRAQARFSKLRYREPGSIARDSRCGRSGAEQGDQPRRSEPVKGSARRRAAGVPRAASFGGHFALELKRYDEAPALEGAAPSRPPRRRRHRRGPEQSRRPGAPPGRDAAARVGGLLPDEGDRRGPRSRLHVQPRLRVRARPESIRGRSTGCARRSAAIRPTPMRTTCSPWRCRRRQHASSRRASAISRAQLSSRYEELDRRAAENRTAVPPGLERMRMDLEGPAAAADQTIVNSAQREQRELAAFHLDQGRRLFEREQDRRRRWRSCGAPCTCRPTRRRRTC